MKVLWLSHLVPFPPKGGVLQRSYNLLRELARYHEVHLLAFVQRDLLAATLGSVEEGKRAAAAALGDFCAGHCFFDIPSESKWAGRERTAASALISQEPYDVHWLRSPEMARAIDLYFRSVPFDLVHFDTIGLASYRRHAAGVKRVLDHHNIESEMMYRRAANERRLPFRAYFHLEAGKLRRYEQQSCPDFDLHITCSEVDSRRLARLSPGMTIREVPNGVDTDYFMPSQRPPQPATLIFAGGLNWYPNRSAMLYFAREVWPLLRRVVPQVTMQVVGKHPPEELLRLSREDPRFRVLGFVDDVRPFLDSAAVYVCPIHDGGGTRLKLLDAMAMRKPIVADPVACEGLAVTDGREVLLARSPEEYVEQIRALIEDEALARRMGAAGRELVERCYAFRTIGRDLAQLYEGLLDSPQPVGRSAVSS